MTTLTARRSGGTRGPSAKPVRAAVSLRTLLRVLREPELALWFIVLVITPFYTWKSGRPQPADFVSVLILPVLMARGGLPSIFEPLRGPVRLVFAFATYAALINLFWGILLLDHNVQKVGAIGFAAFYFFNGYVFAICVLLYSKFGTRLFVVTAWATVAAILSQLALFAIRGGHGLFREKLFFNNPNQLGYYALLAAALIAFGYARGRVPFWLAGVTLATTAFFAALSLSKAAMIGAVAVAIVAAMRKPLLIVVTGGLILVGMQVSDPTALVEKVEFRMADLGSQGDDTLAGRGYSRIEMHPEYLVLGAGEVGHDRHGDFGGELHSSWGTVLFSYGVVGMALLLVFFWRTLRFLRPADFLYLVPIFWYGLTHHGLRFRLFWVFLAFVCIAAVHDRRSERARAPQRLRVIPTPKRTPPSAATPMPPRPDDTVPAE